MHIYKVFKARHTAEGIIHDRVFAQPPTEEQLAEQHARCSQRHGTEHRKTGRAFRTWGVETYLLSDTAIAGLEEAELPEDNIVHTSGDAVAEGRSDAPVMTVKGVGRILNPDDPEHPRNKQ